MEEQKQKAREGQNFSQKLTTAAGVFDGLDDKITSEFVGYDALTAEGKVVGLASETELVNTLNEGETGTLITDVTPFYATMGGQKGDFGVIRTKNGTFEVTETVKIAGGRIGHVGKVVSGSVSVNDTAELAVDTDNRKSVCKNHSATHLLTEGTADRTGRSCRTAGFLPGRRKNPFRLQPRTGCDCGRACEGRGSGQ